MIRKKQNYMAKVPSFITKLYNSIEGNSLITFHYMKPFTITEEDSLKWNNEGTSFIITDYPKFTEETLIKVYKNPNYNSFARQLNLYKKGSFLNFFFLATDSAS